MLLIQSTNWLTAGHLKRQNPRHTCKSRGDVGYVQVSLIHGSATTKQKTFEFVCSTVPFSWVQCLLFSLGILFWIDDLRKSRGLHSVSAYRHGLYIYRSRPVGVAQSSHAFVGGTVSTRARWRIPINKGRKGIRNADQALTVRGEHADRIAGSPSW